MNKAKLLENMREILGKLTPMTDYRTGFENAIYVVNEMLNEDPVQPMTPAIEWKPINITQIKVGEHYLLWGHKWECPDVAQLSGSGYFISERTEMYDDERVTYRESDLTHYAEFNKPEGTE